MPKENGSKEVFVEAEVDNRPCLVSVWLSEADLQLIGEERVNAVRNAIKNEVLVGDHAGKVLVVWAEDSFSENENMGVFVSPDKIQTKGKWHFVA